MPSCEKCWRDSAIERMFNDENGYRKLIERRDAEGKTCTPEEQAGPDATDCDKCQRRTRHQHCQVCMACGDDPARARP